MVILFYFDHLPLTTLVNFYAQRNQINLFNILKNQLFCNEDPVTILKTSIVPLWFVDPLVFHYNLFGVSYVHFGYPVTCEVFVDQSLVATCP